MLLQYKNSLKTTVICVYTKNLICHIKNVDLKEVDVLYLKIVRRKIKCIKWDTPTMKENVLKAYLNFPTNCNFQNPREASSRSWIFLIHCTPAVPNDPSCPYWPQFTVFRSLGQSCHIIKSIKPLKIKVNFSLYISITIHQI